MKHNLNEEIICGSDLCVIGTPSFSNSVVHVICNRGSARFSYSGRPFRMEKDNIAVVSRPSLVSDVEPDADFECEYVAAPDKFLHNLLPANNYAIQGCVSLFDNPIIIVDAEGAANFRRDIANIRHRLAQTDHHFFRELMGSLCQTMIYDLFDFHVRVNDSMLTTDRVGYIVAQFFALIEGGCARRERDVAYYADRLNVSAKYLSDIIKRVSGLTVSAHINRSATAIIIDYLNNSQLSIIQIADEMNFSSPSYFSRYCTKHIGMSPSQFRTAGDKSLAK